MFLLYEKTKDVALNICSPLNLVDIESTRFEAGVSLERCLLFLLCAFHCFLWYFQFIQLSIHAHVHFLFTKHRVLLSCIRLQHITLFQFSWEKYTKHAKLGSWPFRVWSVSLPCFHRYETANIFNIEHTVIKFFQQIFNKCYLWPTCWRF